MTTRTRVTNRHGFAVLYLNLGRQRTLKRRNVCAERTKRTRFLSLQNARLKEEAKLLKGSGQ